MLCGAKGMTYATKYYEIQRQGKSKLQEGLAMKRSALGKWRRNVIS